MLKEIKTTGDLRKYLSDVLIKITSEEITTEQATAVAKVASQVNESMNVEIKHQKIAQEVGKTAVELGKTLIGCE